MKNGKASQPFDHLPEDLLGGYATNTLTEEERKRLFKAALHDQELFNALADEEELRQLLSNPDVRKRLLSVLPNARIVRPLWRRPAALGVAASLLMALVVLVQIRRNPVRSLISKPAEKSISDDGITNKNIGDKDSLSPQAAPSAQPLPVLADSVSEAPTPMTARPRAVTANPKTLQETTPEALASEGASRSVTSAAGGPSVSGSMAAGRVGASTAEKPTLVTPEAPSPLPGQNPNRDRNHDQAAHLEAETNPVQAEPLRDRKMKMAKKELAKDEEKRTDLPAPTCSLVAQPSGYILKVRHSRQGWLYVILRSGKSSVLKPTQTLPQAAGWQEDHFELPASPMVDLYLLEAPLEHPESLPTEGTVRGHRQRIKR